MPTFGQYSRSLLTLAVSASLAFAIATTTACIDPTGVTDRVTTDGLRYTSAPSLDERDATRAAGLNCGYERQPAYHLLLAWRVCRVDESLSVGRQVWDARI